MKSIAKDSQSQPSPLDLVAQLRDSNQSISDISVVISKQLGLHASQDSLPAICSSTSPKKIGLMQFSIELFLTGKDKNGSILTQIITFCDKITPKMAIDHFDCMVLDKGDKVLLSTGLEMLTREIKLLAQNKIKAFFQGIGAKQKYFAEIKSLWLANRAEFNPEDSGKKKGFGNEVADKLYGLCTKSRIYTDGITEVINGSNDKKRELLNFVKMLSRKDRTSTSRHIGANICKMLGRLWMEDSLPSIDFYHRNLFHYAAMCAPNIFYVILELAEKNPATRALFRNMIFAYDVEQNNPIFYALKHQENISKLLRQIVKMEMVADLCHFYPSVLQQAAHLNNYSALNNLLAIIEDEYIKELMLFSEYFGKEGAFNFCIKSNAFVSEEKYLSLATTYAAFLKYKIKKIFNIYIDSVNILEWSIYNNDLFLEQFAGYCSAKEELPKFILTYTPREEIERLIAIFDASFAEKSSAFHLQKIADILRQALNDKIANPIEEPDEDAEKPKWQIMRFITGKNIKINVQEFVAMIDGGNHAEVNMNLASLGSMPEYLKFGKELFLELINTTEPHHEARIFFLHNMLRWHQRTFNLPALLTVINDVPGGIQLAIDLALQGKPTALEVVFQHLALHAVSVFDVGGLFCNFSEGERKFYLSPSVYFAIKLKNMEGGGNLVPLVKVCRLMQFVYFRFGPYVDICTIDSELDAIFNGNKIATVDEVAFLMEAGANVANAGRPLSCRDSNYNLIALFLCGGRGNIVNADPESVAQLTELYLKNAKQNLPIMQSDNNGRTPITACHTLSLPFLEYVAAKVKPNVAEDKLRDLLFVRSSSGETALWYAAHSKDKGMIGAITTNSADAGLATYIEKNSKTSPLVLAVKNNNYIAIQAYIAASINRKLSLDQVFIDGIFLGMSVRDNVTHCNNSGFHALLFDKKSMVAMDILFKISPAISSFYFFGRSIVYWCFVYEREDLLQYLAKNFGESSANKYRIGSIEWHSIVLLMNGSLPHIAKEKKDSWYKIVTGLVKYSPAMISPDQSPDMILNQMIAKKSVDLKVLMDCVNSTLDIYGETLEKYNILTFLFRAIAHNNSLFTQEEIERVFVIIFDLVKTKFVNLGIELWLPKEEDVHYPLHWLALCPKYIVNKAITEFNLAPNIWYMLLSIQDSTGQTVWHYVARNYDPEIVSLFFGLLQKNAYVNLNKMLDENGANPVKLAMLHNNVAFIEILEKKYAFSAQLALFDKMLTSMREALPAFVEAKTKAEEKAKAAAENKAAGTAGTEGEDEEDMDLDNYEEDGEDFPDYDGEEKDDDDDLDYGEDDEKDEDMEDDEEDDDDDYMDEYGEDDDEMDAFSKESTDKLKRSSIEADLDDDDDDSDYDDESEEDLLEDDDLENEDLDLALQKERKSIAVKKNALSVKDDLMGEDFDEDVSFDKDLDYNNGSAEDLDGNIDSGEIDIDLEDEEDDEFFNDDDILRKDIDRKSRSNASLADKLDDDYEYDSAKRRKQYQEDEGAEEETEIKTRHTGDGAKNRTDKLSEHHNIADDLGFSAKGSKKGSDERKIAREGGLVSEDLNHDASVKHKRGNRDFYSEDLDAEYGKASEAEEMRVRRYARTRSFNMDEFDENIPLNGKISDSVDKKDKDIRSFNIDEFEEGNGAAGSGVRRQDGKKYRSFDGDEGHLNEIESASMSGKIDMQSRGKNIGMNKEKADLAVREDFVKKADMAVKNSTISEAGSAGFSFRPNKKIDSNNSKISLDDGHRGMDADRERLKHSIKKPQQSKYDDHLDELVQSLAMRMEDMGADDQQKDDMNLQYLITMSNPLNLDKIAEAIEKGASLARSALKAEPNGGTIPLILLRAISEGGDMEKLMYIIDICSSEDLKSAINYQDLRQRNICHLLACCPEELYLHFAKAAKKHNLALSVNLLKSTDSYGLVPILMWKSAHNIELNCIPWYGLSEYNEDNILPLDLLIQLQHSQLIHLLTVAVDGNSSMIEHYIKNDRADLVMMIMEHLPNLPIMKLRIPDCTVLQLASELKKNTIWWKMFHKMMLAFNQDSSVKKVLETLPMKHILQIKSSAKYIATSCGNEKISQFLNKAMMIFDKLSYNGGQSQ